MCDILCPIVHFLDKKKSLKMDSNQVALVILAPLAIACFILSAFFFILVIIGKRLYLNLFWKKDEEKSLKPILLIVMYSGLLNSIIRIVEYSARIAESFNPTPVVTIFRTTSTFLSYGVVCYVFCGTMFLWMGVIQVVTIELNKLVRIVKIFCGITLAVFSVLSVYLVIIYFLNALSVFTEEAFQVQRRILLFGIVPAYVLALGIITVLLLIMEVYVFRLLMKSKRKDDYQILLRRIGIALIFLSFAFVIRMVGAILVAGQIGGIYATVLIGSIPGMFAFKLIKDF